jgi:hypothetical protein
MVLLELGTALQLKLVDGSGTPTVVDSRVIDVRPEGNTIVHALDRVSVVQNGERMTAPVEDDEGDRLFYVLQSNPEGTRNELQIRDERSVREAMNVQEVSKFTLAKNDPSVVQNDGDLLKDILPKDWEKGYMVEFKARDTAFRAVITSRELVDNGNILIFALKILEKNGVLPLQEGGKTINWWLGLTTKGTVELAGSITKDFNQGEFFPVTALRLVGIAGKIDVSGGVSGGSTRGAPQLAPKTTSKRFGGKKKKRASDTRVRLTRKKKTTKKKKIATQKKKKKSTNKKKKVTKKKKKTKKGKKKK